MAAAIVRGDRAALARGITLLESRRPDRAAEGAALLAELLPRTGGAVRVGITGVPGVGKSTFIEALGCRLVAEGQRVAVLAVDPSSPRTRGAILGDKTRMPRLATAAAAYVRPSPSAGMLGGVAQTSRETLHLCEAAGFDVVLVETVGVGQSETEVAELVDTFLVLALPGAGDELQGIKKGIVELADLLAVTKADGPSRLAVQQAARHWAGALHIIADPASGWRVPVLTVSSIEGTGIAETWAAILAHRRQLASTGALAAKRRAQDARWLKALLDEALRRLWRELPEVDAAIRAAEAGVAAGEVAPLAAVTAIVDALRRRLGGGG